jgi:hypothetical protein
MLGIQLSRYRAWILQGATRDQWEEIRTVLRTMRCLMFVVYQKGRPANVYYLDQDKRIIKPSLKDEADEWFQRQRQDRTRVVPISRSKLLRDHEDVRNPRSPKLR